MTIDLITIFALALFGLGVYCRNCVLSDRCANLEARKNDLEADNARLRESNQRHVLETTALSLELEQLHGEVMWQADDHSQVAWGVN